MNQQVTYEIQKHKLPLTTKRYYRVDEVARYFSVCDQTVYRLIDMGDLKAIRVMGCIRVPVEELREFEERSKVDF